MDVTGGVFKLLVMGSVIVSRDAVTETVSFLKSTFYLALYDGSHVTPLQNFTMATTGSEG